MGRKVSEPVCRDTRGKVNVGPNFGSGLAV